jgi:DNA-binding LytR/AlgR family response regulator
MKTENQVLIGGYKKISPANILLLKADTNYTITYLTDGSHFLSATTLGIMEERLKGFNFYRTHRSTLVNMQYISNYEGINLDNLVPEIMMMNKINIPIARRKISDFLKTLQVMMVS